MTGGPDVATAAEDGSDRTDRELARVTAHLLEQGRTIDTLSRIATAAGLLALFVPDVPLALSMGVVALGAVEAYLSLRVGFDSILFREMAAGVLEMHRLDMALVRLGLVVGPTSPRPMASRADGARRLLMLQAGATAAQLVLAVAGAMLARMS